MAQSTRSGYFYSYESRSGKLVYLHRQIAEKSLGRPLLDSEVIHHIDENKTNNDPSNLLVFKTNGDHVRFHNLSESTKEVLRLDDGAYICRVKPSKACLICGTLFHPSKKGTSREQKCCSHSCAAKLNIAHNKKAIHENPSLLHKEIWDRPTVEVAKKYGVSDTAIKQTCKKYSIPSPPRGFWNKIKFNKLEGQSCPLPD